MVRKIMYLIITIPLIAGGQSLSNYKDSNSTQSVLLTNNCVQWLNDLTFQEVKNKAMKDQKCIFLDCFTTWCQPCKQMDKYVYTNDTVAVFLNKHFLSIKVQMNQTHEDVQQVQSWYKDAADIAKRYHVLAYPTYIFLSPEGTVIYKATGYKTPGVFLEVANTALKPAIAYRDPFEKYDSLVQLYRLGSKNYSLMPYIIEKARQANDIEMLKLVSKDYLNYLTRVPKHQLYTKENMQFIASIMKSDSKFISMFYPDGQKVDSIMKHPGYAQHVIDQLILNEIVSPFLRIPISNQGWPWNGEITDSSEANWSKLRKQIVAKYDVSYGDRNILNAKISWYRHHNNLPAAAKSYFEKLTKFGVDTMEKYGNSNFLTEHVILNSYAWEVFSWVNQIDLLKQAANLMKGVVERGDPTGEFFDTYANLLYKIGEKKEAISWEEKALINAIQCNVPEPIKDISKCLDKMRRGQSTWNEHK